MPPVATLDQARPGVVLRPLRGVALGVFAALLSVFVGTGWTDGLRGWGVLAAGPHVAGALPLRELAGGADQPLLRVIAGWLPTGVLAGLVLRRHRPATRIALLGVPFLLLFAVLSDAAFALVHNLRAADVIATRPPSAATFVTTACLVAGAALVSGGRQRRPGAGAAWRSRSRSERR